MKICLNDRKEKHEEDEAYERRNENGNVTGISVSKRGSGHHKMKI